MHELIELLKANKIDLEKLPSDVAGDIEDIAFITDDYEEEFDDNELLDKVLDWIKTNRPDAIEGAEIKVVEEPEEEEIEEEEPEAEEIEEQADVIVNIKSVTILWTEGYEFEPPTPQTFSTLAEANQYLRTKPDLPDAGYDKTKFQITYEDGFEYTGRLDLSTGEDNPILPNLIGRHIAEYIIYLIMMPNSYGGIYENVKARDEHLSLLKFYELGVSKYSMSNYVMNSLTALVIGRKWDTNQGGLIDVNNLAKNFIFMYDHARFISLAEEEEPVVEEPVVEEPVVEEPEDEWADWGEIEEPAVVAEAPISEEQEKEQEAQVDQAEAGIEEVPEEDIIGVAFEKADFDQPYKFIQLLGLAKFDYRWMQRSLPLGVCFWGTENCYIACLINPLTNEGKTDGLFLYCPDLDRRQKMIRLIGIKGSYKSMDEVTSAYFSKMNSVRWVSGEMQDGVSDFDNEPVSKINYDDVDEAVVQGFKHIDSHAKLYTLCALKKLQDENEQLISGDSSNFPAIVNDMQGESIYIEGISKNIQVNWNLIHELSLAGFVDPDSWMLSDLGENYIRLHRFCFPMNTHPFNSVYNTAERLYRGKVDYNVVTDLGTFYTPLDELDFFESGGKHLPIGYENAIKNEELSKRLQILINGIGENLIVFEPHSFCVGKLYSKYVDNDDPSNITGEINGIRENTGYIVLHNYFNAKEIYIISHQLNYFYKNYGSDLTIFADKRFGGADMAFIYKFDKENVEFSELIGIIRIEVTSSDAGLNSNFSFGLYDHKETEKIIKNENYNLFYNGITLTDFLLEDSEYLVAESEEDIKEKIENVKEEATGVKEEVDDEQLDEQDIDTEKGEVVLPSEEEPVVEEQVIETDVPDVEIPEEEEEKPKIKTAPKVKQAVPTGVVLPSEISSSYKKLDDMFIKTYQLNGTERDVAIIEQYIKVGKKPTLDELVALEFDLTKWFVEDRAMNVNDEYVLVLIQPADLVYEIFDYETAKKEGYLKWLQ